MSERPFIPAAKPLIGDEEITAVTEVMHSGMVVQGPQVQAFEEEFSAAMAPGTYAIAVNSGTSAQHIATMASALCKMGVVSEDAHGKRLVPAPHLMGSNATATSHAHQEVIVPSFTFAATANSVALTGARPVFADIDPRTFTLDPASVEAAITERTVAIEVVHLYGLPAAMEEILAIARRYNLDVYEDCAQAHGAMLNGKRVGTFGQWGSFSFYPTKNMTSLEGGMITTTDPDLARVCRLLRNQGMERQYANEVVGLNNRMTDVAAAVGRVQLAKVGGWTQQRQRNAEVLTAGLSPLAGVHTPYVPEGADHVYHQYTICFEGMTGAERDRLAQAMKDEWRVGTGVYYPIPNHRLESLRSFAQDLELPVTEKVARECLSLPVHPSLTEADLERIIEAVHACVSAGA
ncbi:DegT/DnrJ/EryC1/StrS aminotransferase family protein [Schaalia sp. Marseille-Q2122]|uniref:DegT/DnrJ/EryC1/StrS family aminotransferase n=1 Tax=Schaalia sp. Marseille-Q2122 TaxID=2736604 RepID=UPI00158A8694|nr:DegT/DnrJ/EryC1/StrS family aminotransferase [Schaalia sp. Marseille-Q2122]